MKNDFWGNCDRIRSLLIFDFRVTNVFLGMPTSTSSRPLLPIMKFLSERILGSGGSVNGCLNQVPTGIRIVE